jgi:hypothetical protein
LRPASPYNIEKSSVKLCGYDYSSKRILTSDDIVSDASGSLTYAKILENDSYSRNGKKHNRAQIHILKLLATWKTNKNKHSFMIKNSFKKP